MKMAARLRSWMLAVLVCAGAGLVAFSFSATLGSRTAADPGFSSTTRADPGVVSTLEALLESPRTGARASALKWIARDPRAQDARFIPQIFAALKDSAGSVRNQGLANMGWILDRDHDSSNGRQALAAIEAALRQTSDRAAQLVALDLIGGSGQGGVYASATGAHEDPFLISNPSVRTLIFSMLANPQASLRPQLLSLVEGSPRLQHDPAIIGAIAAALQDDDLSVRSDAVDLLIKIFHQGQPSLRQKVKPVLLAALEMNDPNVQLRASRALGVPIPPPKPQPRLVSLTGKKLAITDVPFDFNFFTAFVQPLFVKKYGNAACVDCHTPQSNSLGKFRVLAPGPTGRYTLQQSRINFVSVLAVINRQNPLKSKLLLKPLDPTTREGDLRGLNHDGGVFWRNQFDPDFEIVADWLKGAKLETPPQKQLDFAYFVQRIEPIFSTPGPDGFACINCHSTHAILHLESPETRDGKFSLAQLINNYQSAQRVVDETAPSHSYIVRKPTSPREGVPGGLSHAGGIRWPDKKESWQYKALITWMGNPNLAQVSGAARASISANSSRY